FEKVLIIPENAISCQITFLLNECNELYLANSSGDAFQFIGDINGTQWDGRLVQLGDGDPYKTVSSGNGNSDLATGDAAWEGFLRALALTAGEATDLPIWNFYLKPVGK